MALNFGNPKSVAAPKSIGTNVECVVQVADMQILAHNGVIS